MIFLRPVETEAFEGLDDGEAGVLDTPERGAVCTQSGLTIDEFGEIIDVRALLAGSAGSQSRGVFTDERQTQVFELAIKCSDHPAEGEHHDKEGETPVRGAELD